MLAAHWVVLAWAFVIAFIDLYARRIPNLLSLGAVAIGLGYAIYTGQAVLGSHWPDILLGLLLAVLLAIPAYLRGGLGAGDAKLLLAIAMLGGWKAVLISFTFAGVLGIITIFGMYHYSKYFRRHVPKGRWLPFGAMLAIGFIANLGVES